MKNNKLEEGDIFYVPYKEKYIFGKILLDISERILKAEEKNPMWGLADCYMVGVFDGVFNEPILNIQNMAITSAFTSKKYFYSKQNRIDWHYYGNNLIDFKKLVFPENIISHNNDYYFQTGELNIPITIKNEQYDNGGEFDIKRTISPSFMGILRDSLYYMNRKDLMDFVPAILYDKKDLHFNIPARSKIYRMIGENPNISYYDLALKYGYDLARFY